MLHWSLVTATLHKPRKTQWGRKPRVPWSSPKQAGVRQSAERPSVLSLGFNLISSYFNFSHSVRQGGGEWEGREGGEPGHSSQQESSTAKPCTGAQEHAVCTGLGFGAASGMAQIAQEQCCPKPGSRNSSWGMSCNILSYIRKSTRFLQKLCRNNKMLCTTVIYIRAISLSSVALCEVAQLLSQQ